MADKFKQLIVSGLRTRGLMDIIKHRPPTIADVSAANPTATPEKKQETKRLLYCELFVVYGSVGMVSVPRCDTGTRVFEEEMLFDIACLQ